MDIITEDELQYSLNILNQYKSFFLKKEFNKINKNDKKLINIIHKIFNSRKFINNKIFSNLLNKNINYYNFNEKSIFNTDYNISIKQELNENGYFILNKKLNKEKINNILNQLNNKEFNNHELRKTINIPNIFNPPSGRHMIKNQSDILNIKEVQDLVTDPLILKICQDYLETNPILIQTNFWVTNGEEKGYGDNTTKFHQDFDDIRFIKIFIYLSDVNSDNGPHSYVKGSINNIKAPNNYKTYGRLSDDELEKNYGKENILSFEGEEGTMIFENTYGFHKGKNLKKGKRYMLQFQFAGTTFFGTDKNLKPIKYNSDKMKNFIEKYPDCGLFLE